MPINRKVLQGPRCISLVLMLFVFLWLSPTVAQQPCIRISEPFNSSIVVAVDQRFHETYSLRYPMTYEFSYPTEKSHLRVYRKYDSVETWEQLTEESRDDFFNGIEFVRFDYIRCLAFVSEVFRIETDSVFLIMLTASGEKIPIQFQIICKYYDDRDAAVTITAEDATV